MRRGISTIMEFLVAFGLLIIIAAVVTVFNVSAGGLGDEPEFNYQIEGVTRFQSCDITLLALLRADTGNGYDYADAIAMGNWESIKESAQGYIDVAIDEQAEIQLASCTFGETCCSQIVPLFTPTSSGVNAEVSIVVK